VGDFGRHEKPTWKEEIGLFRGLCRAVSSVFGCRGIAAYLEEGGGLASRQDPGSRKVAEEYSLFFYVLVTLRTDIVPLLAGPGRTRSLPRIRPFGERAIR